MNRQISISDAPAPCDDSNQASSTGTATRASSKQSTAENTPTEAPGSAEQHVAATFTQSHATIPDLSLFQYNGSNLSHDMMHSTMINQPAPYLSDANASPPCSLTTSNAACSTVPVWTKPMTFPYTYSMCASNYPPTTVSAPVTSVVHMANTYSYAPSVALNNFQQFPMHIPSVNPATFAQQNVCSGNTRQNHFNFSSRHNVTSDFNLTSSQIAARQVIAKELPTFSGKPEEWPIFITSLIQSTERCGFSDQENLLRLQKCLKGPALEAVRGKLLTPSTVNSAIDTLKMLFGRADIIHQKMSRKLRLEPAVKSEKLETLIHLALAVQNYCSTIEAIGLGDYLNDPALLADLLEKLPSDLKLDWCRHQMFLQRATIKAFDSWLFTLASCASQVTTFGQSNTEEKRPARQRLLVHDIADNKVDSVPQPVSCYKCSENHRLTQCPTFTVLNINDRWNFTQQNGICFRCLKKHLARRCNSRKQCGVDGCKMPHHPLLHAPKRCGHDREEFRSVPRDHEVEPKPENRVVTFHSVERKKALFRYIPVRLHGANKTFDTFALIDEGSACTLLENAIADELNLHGPLEELCLKWTGDITHNETNSRVVRLTISSPEQGARKFDLQNVRTVSSLDLPRQSLDAQDIKVHRHLHNLPIAPYQHVRARILIGLDNAKIGLPQKTIEVDGDGLIAAKCRLGWSVYGCKNNSDFTPPRVLHICDGKVDDNMDEMLKFYFSLDSVGVAVKNCTLQSRENERALRIMESTSKYIPKERRWETGLLWKHDEINLPDSFPMARQRLHCLEVKMNRDPALKKFLIDTIQRYKDQGYIRRLAKDEISTGGKSWYLPIFTVRNINKNKTRLVWDAAAKIDNVALNTYLTKGPDYLTSLVGVLIRFREKTIALCGDIKEMFHQVLVRKEDQQAQKFLWRDGDTSKELEVYVMQVMTFGASCSPSLANFIRDKNADRWKEAFPKAVKAIKENTYVDDWLQSAETEDEMIDLSMRVRRIHAEGRFEMRNWSSNSRRVLKALTQSSVEIKKSFDEFNAVAEKVLGLW